MQDYQLEQLKNEMDAAQRDIDIHKSCLDSVTQRRDSLKDQISSLKYEIANLKNERSREYDAAAESYRERSHEWAAIHKCNAQSLGDSIADKYSILDSYFEQLNVVKSERDSVFEAFKEAKERKYRALDEFKRRLEIVRAERDAERAKWHEKSCRKCGSIIRYHEDWNHIPNYCKACKINFKTAAR